MKIGDYHVDNIFVLCSISKNKENLEHFLSFKVNKSEKSLLINYLF